MQTDILMEEPSIDFLDYSKNKTLLCYCRGLCPNQRITGQCKTQPGGKCFIAEAEEVEGINKEKKDLIYGCLPPSEMAILQCRGAFMKPRNKSIKCCDDYNFCNKFLMVSTSMPKKNKNSTATPKKNESPTAIDIISIILTVLSIAMILFTLIKIGLRYFRAYMDLKRHEKSKSVEVGADDFEIGTLSVSGRTFAERTLSNDILFDTIIAKGNYSEIWKGKWRSEIVSVKKNFNPDSRTYWQNEVNILQDNLIRHSNIIGYIDSYAVISEENEIFYLVTKYYKNGSLRDFLQSHTLNPTEILDIIIGLSSGLSFLHNAIFGHHNKPFHISHNNINSKSILVNAEKKCCLSDFSKATKFLPDREENNLLENSEPIQNSEIHYLPPEFFNVSYKPSNKELIMGDIYSFALIMWEIMNRCESSSQTNILPNQYQIPYEAELLAKNLEFSKENMEDLVAIRNIRPQLLRNEWKTNRILNEIIKIMKECWHLKPQSRLSCLRIKKSLLKIKEETDQST